MPLLAWDFLSVIRSGIQGLIAPERCIACLQEGSWLCAQCRPNISAMPQLCIACDAEVSRGRTCLQCRDETPLSGVVSAAPYSSRAIRRGIHWLKFKGITPVGNELATLLLPRLSHIAPLRILSNEAVLVPIPLHPRRMRIRGFNQSEYIAQQLALFTGISIRNVLHRSLSTRAQATLPHRLRHLNVLDAFAPIQSAIQSIQSANYIIFIDDVVTSGATLEAAAQALSPTLPDSTQLWATTIARG